MNRHGFASIDKVLGGIVLGAVLLFPLKTWLTHWILQQPRWSSASLTPYALPQARLDIALSPSSITVQQNPDESWTDVEMRVIHPSLKALEFQFPLLPDDQVCSALETQLESRLNCPAP